LVFLIAILLSFGFHASLAFGALLVCPLFVYEFGHNFFSG
jgi:hypothetical protein